MSIDMISSLERLYRFFGSGWTAGRSYTIQATIEEKERTEIMAKSTEGAEFLVFLW